MRRRTVHADCDHDTSQAASNRCLRERRFGPAKPRFQQVIIDGQKACSTCHIVKPLSDYRQRARSGGGYDPRCKQCALDYNRMRRYGITKAEYDRRLEDQGGRCRICL